MWCLNTCPSYSRSGGSTRSKLPDLYTCQLLNTNAVVHREYSGAALISKQLTQDTSLHSKFHPDSPAPQFECECDFEPTLESQRLEEEEEEDARLMQHAHLESLKQASRNKDRFLSAHTDIPAANADNDWLRSPLRSPSCSPASCSFSSRSPSRSPTPPLPIEYNKEGRLTAAAKGKHQSN